MKTLHVTERLEWRAWLQANGEKEKEIWLVFYRKHTGKKILVYDEAVEEALCFGWIDSIIKRLDEKTYARKFTPRNRGSKWSELNMARAKKMIAAGLMTPVGSALIDPGLLRNKRVPRPASPAGDLANSRLLSAKAWPPTKKPGFSLRAWPHPTDACISLG